MNRLCRTLSELLIRDIRFYRNLLPLQGVLYQIEFVFEFVIDGVEMNYLFLLVQSQLIVLRELNFKSL